MVLLAWPILGLSVGADLVELVGGAELDEFGARLGGGNVPRRHEESVARLVGLDPFGIGDGDLSAKRYPQCGQGQLSPGRPLSSSARECSCRMVTKSTVYSSTGPLMSRAGPASSTVGAVSSRSWA